MWSAPEQTIEQNNGDDNTCVILFLTRHNAAMYDDENDDLQTSTSCLIHSIYIPLMTSQSSAGLRMKTTAINHVRSHQCQLKSQSILLKKHFILSCIKPQFLNGFNLIWFEFIIFISWWHQLTFRSVFHSFRRFILSNENAIIFVCGTS